MKQQIDTILFLYAVDTVIWNPQKWSKNQERDFIKKKNGSTVNAMYVKLNEKLDKIWNILPPKGSLYWRPHDEHFLSCSWKDPEQVLRTCTPFLPFSNPKLQSAYFVNYNFLRFPDPVVHINFCWNEKTLPPNRKKDRKKDDTQLRMLYRASWKKYRVGGKRWKLFFNI